MTQERRRLVFVIHYPVFGGPHNQALRLHRALQERGWDQTVLLPDEPGNAEERLREAGVPVRTLRLQRLRALPDPRLQIRFASGFWSDVGRIRASIRELDAQLVMVGGLVNPHAALAARLEGVPLVWQIVDTRAPMGLRRVMMPVVRGLADSVLCTGALVAEAHPGALALGDRLVRFFPPVDTQEFAPSKRRRHDARRALKLEESDLVVGMVGNLNPQKGQETFLSAAAHLRESQPRVRFLLLGAAYPQHEAYVSRLKARAADLGFVMGHDLIVTDPGGAVADLAAAFDVFWLTSEPRSEGIPTVVEEAMALALPVVSTDVGSVREAVDEGETGFVVPPHDAEQMAQITDRLIRDRSAREQMGLRARAVAVDRFGIAQCADAHVEAFDVARGHAAAGADRGFDPPRLNADVSPILMDLPSVGACPSCRGDLDWRGESVRCRSCGAEYSSVHGVPVLLPPEDDAQAATEEGTGHKLRQMLFFDEEADSEYETSRPHGTPSLHGWLLGEKYVRSVSSIDEGDGLRSALAVCGGSGMDAEFLARSGLSVVSADISLKAAQRAAERSQRQGIPIKSVVADVEHLPFADRSFDLVYVHDGLHHLEDPLSGLSEMARVARRAVVVTEPAAASITRIAVRLGLALDYEEAGNRVARVDPRWVAAELTARGFEVRSSRRYLMYYRHESSWVARFLSRRRLRPFARAAYLSIDHLLGGLGNKLSLSAVRNDGDGIRD